MQVESVKYMSASRNCLVTFEGIRKETRKGVQPWGMEKFVQHSLEIDPEKDYGVKRGKGKDIINRLKTHPANRLNGGIEFWELDQNALDIMNLAEGTLVARAPAGGVSKDLDKQLDVLYKAINGYKKEDHKDIVEVTRGLFDTFTVMGLPKPDPDYDQLRVKGRLIEFFSILKDRDIWEAKAA